MFPICHTISNDLISNQVKTGQWYELPLLHTLATCVLPQIKTRVCLDIGANIGTFCLYMEKHFDKIFAFEPQKEVYACLEKSISDNKFMIQAFNVGASNQQGWYEIEEERNNTGAAKILPDTFSEAGNSTKKQFYTIILDNHFPQLPVDFMKIDIEGHELFAIQGAKSIIEIFQPVIVCEVMGRHFDTETNCELENYLESLGYVHKYLVLREGIFKINKIERRINPMVLFSTREFT